MHTKRFISAAVLGAVVLSAGVAPTRAATPTAAPASPEPLMASTERPLTPAEQRLSDAKVAAAELFVARLRARGFGLASLDCVPNIAPVSGPATAASTLSSPTSQATAATCAPPSGFLTVEARQQAEDHWCGPAVGQVISNYAWAAKAGKNKFTQAVIAGWMSTDVNGQTSAPALVTGLQKATAGSPRHAASFSWGITDLRDTDGDGATGDQLHNYVMSAISSVKMPVAIAVKPHQVGSSDFLSSWPDPINSGGHWITAYGWSGTWDGAFAARTYYADSSGQQGGGTGKYSDPTSEIARMIGAHTRRIVW
jgi:hypothetical protein